MKFQICKFGKPIIEVTPSEIIAKFVPSGYTQAYDLYIVPEMVQRIQANDATKLAQGTVDALNDEQEHFFRQRPGNPGEFKPEPA